MCASSDGVREALRWACHGTGARFLGDGGAKGLPADGGDREAALGGGREIRAGSW